MRFFWQPFIILGFLLLGLGIGDRAFSLPLRLEEAAIASQLESLPEWTREGQLLRREFVFGDFREAIAFVQSLVEPVDDAGHHPDITISYNKVTLILTTHDVGGLTQLDLDVAELINQLFADLPEEN
ncbi:4a-hydroxytetrahydrobiopterin dehydratase [Spirulina sp. 06S082]|uniref:4a-hydroxytetrahydrobiopterin dehydratase n=1 Tax=Spirulina sp. 06S082 TaxID=3110248 RepID=UPI002B20117D|nr:4a-hydroxytetrahydrobiopterin dehydratase [Spirulina sp. 06S082]MEA5472420.1 4a-hydroxytetrahydrobiopterin dehydratase [Spirulina sp. 06S082]